MRFADWWDHGLARLGYRRMDHRVPPGLYSIGEPGVDAPVLVTANYKLSFDAVRRALAGRNAYILVLDTQAVNVWCAAGKGTFSTDELVRRIGATELPRILTARKLILPQLGAPGVAAHEVKRRTGFSVDYGPVRAADLPEYLDSGRVTEEMRRVRFPMRDRIAVALVDAVKAIPPVTVVGALLFLFGGPWPCLALVSSALAGVFIFPILLPVLPTRSFCLKGLLLGGLVALPFAVGAYARGADSAGWMRVGGALTYLLAFPPITAYLALLFTGSTTFTSRSGVRREIFTYIRPMAFLFAGGVGLAILLRLAALIGGRV